MDLLIRLQVAEEYHPNTKGSLFIKTINLIASYQINKYIVKHLLNNLTEQEKNSIREQHTGGMNVVTENFSKLIKTKSGDVKPLVNEQPSEPTNKVRFRCSTDSFVWVRGLIKSGVDFTVEVDPNQRDWVLVRDKNGKGCACKREELFILQ